MLVNLRLLLKLLWQPMVALKQLRDRAPVGFTIGASWLMTMLYATIGAVMLDYAHAGRAGALEEATNINELLSSSRSLVERFWLSNFYDAGMAAVFVILFVAVIYVPFAILIANLFEKRGSFSLVLRDDYASVLSCSLGSLATSLLVTILPAVVIGWQSTWLGSDAVMGYFVLLIVIPLPVFAALMTLTLGTVFQIGWAAAAITTILSFLSLLGIPLLLQAATFLCASPFLLLLLLFLLRDRVDDFMRSARAKQSFKQNLENATLNPADASAHYNLGLLYQQRAELAAATASFRRAIEIDSQEIDAHYQLGRIAREQGNYDEAIRHFESVVGLDATHSQHEIWREIALVYHAAGQYADALQMLERFLNERPSDAQGRYWRGLTLHELGRDEEAISEMQSCIESVKTAPAYKYRTERQWLHQAQSFLRERQ
ncbi:MAG: tetratricopeptide repeat protein [Blastocatellia bacterium]|nr:tetratricopeptide repeat protein [Blastocatellia bacterium]